ncbi:MAG: hypothetical protein ABIF19_12055 [Planctomycetota bacterium]
MREEKRLNRNQKARLEKALVRLVGSTRRARRAKNLLEVAEELAVAEDLLTSRKTVAEKIGVSEEMLREFASVNRLSKSVKEMVKDGHLTGIDVTYRISMLPKSEQLQVATEYVKGQISGKDVRDVIALRKGNPKWKIQEVIERVKSSRDITHYLIRFRISESARKDILQSKFADILGDKNIVSLEINGKIVNLTVTEEGRKILQREAKKRRITKRKFINLMIERE